MASGSALDPSSARTLVELLEMRSAQETQRPAYTFLLDGEQAEHHLSYAELARSAQALAVALTQRAKVGDRALVLMPPGPGFLVAFFASLYAGLMAVPVPMPQRKRALPRLLAIVHDCRPSIVITTAEFESMFEQSRDDASLHEIAKLPWIAVERLEAHAAAQWRMPNVRSDSAAFLQYTSGSTGSPKGVVLSHGNLLDNQRMIQSAFAHDPQTVVVGWLPPYHDMGLIGNILQPLYVGVPCVQMTPQHFLVRPWRWLDAISRYGGTTSGGPNFAFDLCVAKVTAEQREVLNLSSWKVAFNGAEPVRAATLQRFAKAFRVSGFRREAFYPCYGLAEATLLVSGGAQGQGALLKRFERADLAKGRAVEGPQTATSAVLVGCGQARAGEQLVIVDPERRVVCEPNQVGEIWLAGPSVAQGYWQCAEETSATFHAHLNTGEGPFLRTGDLGFLEDGELFLAGRLKDLIIVRGRNLYPQDLEQTAEESHVQVRSGGVAAFALEGDDEEKVVLVAELDERDTPHEQVAEAVRSAVAERHEVAVHAVVFIKPGSLPRTTSGKVQRRATLQRYLAGELDLVWQAASPGEATPASPLEPFVEEIAAIWREVLHCRSLGENDRFLALGGDSLRAVQVSARIRARFDVDIPSVDLLDSPSLAAFATTIRQAIAGRQSRPLSAPEKHSSSEGVLSFVQERLWLLEQLVSGAPVYHLAAKLMLRGALNIAALERAVSTLVARHEALRTIFPLTPSGPVQKVTATEKVCVPLRELEEGELAQLEEVLVAEASRRFEFATTPPVRWLLVRARAEEHVLLFSCHHLVADGWSMALILRELMALYVAYSQGQDAELPPLQRTYIEHAAEQRLKALAADDAELLYWKRKFETPLRPLELHTDYPRTALQTYTGARHEFVFGRERLARLQKLAERSGATLFNIVAAALFALLKCSSGQADLCLGAPIAGRAHVADEGVVGCFINTLALRVEIPQGLTVTELLERTRAVTVAAQAHQSVPFERLLQELPLERRLNQSPLFQVMLTMQPALAEQLVMPGLDVTAEQLHLGTAQFDMALDLAPRGAELRAALEYNADLFEARTAAHFANRFLLLLDQFAAAPQSRVDQLVLFGSEDEARLCAPRAVTSEEVVRPVHALFEDVARRVPDHVALSDGERKVSYRELNEQANRLAHVLRRRGVQVGSRVALYLERSLDLVISALAILKAGGAYVPIDPAQPNERAQFMMADARVNLVLSHSAQAAQWPNLGVPVLLLDEELTRLQDESALDPQWISSCDAPAYIIYTSGSTGRPKGVLVAHRGLARAVAAWTEVYALKRDSLRLLQLAGPAFDVWTADWTRALCAGGTLIIAPHEAALDPQILWAWLERERVTVVDLVPAQVRALFPLWQRQPAPSCLELIIVGSDVWTVAEYRELRRLCPGVRILSCYGVTEATIDSAWFEADAATATAGTSPVADGSSVPLGKAFPGTRLYVADANGQPLPLGLPGELLIGGEGVAAGYLFRARLTAERFIPDEWSARPGARLYRSGDRARWNADRVLEFLGRVDHQVKVRGVRIELSEIEARLRGHNAIAACSVVCRSDSEGQNHLIAYLVGEGTALDTAGVRDFLREKLPEAMVPSAFVWLDHLPLNANGKVDRLALPAAEPAPRAIVAPESEIERCVAEVWCSVLGIRAVGRDDNFFDVGGHSLLLARVQTELAARLGREVPLLLLFQKPTVSAQALALASTSAPQSGELEPSVKDLQRVAERRSSLRARRRGEPETNG